MSYDIYLNVFAFLMSIVSLFYLNKIRSMLRSVSMTYLFCAVVYGVLGRGLVVFSYSDGIFSIPQVASLFSFYWLLLALGFYTMFLSVKYSISRGGK